MRIDMGVMTMDGILLIDKPYGLTSHDVVFKVRKATKENRIGHCGTLDPIASGVLVLCLGSATKLVKYFTDHDKSYLAEVAIGYETDTFDVTGKTTYTVLNSPYNEASIDEALRQFQGVLTQMPPAYSAIKVNGKKLYEYARRHQAIPEIEPRTIIIDEIYRTTPISINDGIGKFSFFVKCSKGTYIRVICRDLGRKLNSYGTMINLRRMSVGGFNIDETVSLDEVIDGNYQLINPLPYLNMENLVVDENIKSKVLNGMFLSPEWFINLQDTIIYDQKQNPLAIYTYDAQIKMMRLSVML